METDCMKLEQGFKFQQDKDLKTLKHQGLQKNINALTVTKLVFADTVHQI